MKNDSDISGEHEMTPKNKSLSPYLDGLSPDLKDLSPEKTEEVSTKLIDVEDSRYIGDISDIVAELEKNNDHPIETYLKHKSLDRI